MTPGRLFWLIRRDLNRGLAASWHDHITRPRIRTWRNPHATLPVQSVPIHVVAGDTHSDMALWMLASFFLHSGRNWRVVLHDDGKLSETHRNIWRRRGLELTIIDRAEADQLTRANLRNYPALLNYRERHPLALKLIDVPFRLAGQRGLLLDADLAFFARPVEILDWVDRDDGSTWFNADAGEASNLSPDQARDRFDVHLWPRVNSGLCLLAADIIDLDFCEEVLADGAILKGHIWRVEQTLFALCSSRRNRGGLLPPTYEVSLGRSAAEGCIVRHYVGAVRDRFWAEGVARLAPIVLKK